MITACPFIKDTEPSQAIHFKAAIRRGQDDSRGAHWSTFDSRLDALQLNTQQDHEAQVGSSGAFNFYCQTDGCDQ